jgi:mRNA interferase MazF
VSLPRGALVWADLEPVQGHEQGGRRPVLVASRDRFNERSGTVIAFAVTTAHPAVGYPFTLEVPPGLLPQPSWVKLTQVRTLSTRRLGSPVGVVAPEVVRRCLAGLLEHCQR